MSDKLDIKKPVKEILLDKFNAKSGLQIPPIYVELGAVTILPDPTDKEDTKVEFISAKFGFKGEIILIKLLM